MTSLLIIPTVLCVRANFNFLSTTAFLFVSFYKVTDPFLLLFSKRSWINVEINTFWFFNQAHITYQNICLSILELP